MLVEGVDDHVDDVIRFQLRRLCSTGGRCRSKSVCNSFTSLLANYVFAKHTPLSFASWCMLHIHNSASLRGVYCMCRYTTQLRFVGVSASYTQLGCASIVYICIHNS